LWEKAERLQNAHLKCKLGKELPRENTVFFEQVDDSICLVSYSSILAEEYNKETDSFGELQYGLAVVFLKIDDAFIKKMFFYNRDESQHVFQKNTHQWCPPGVRHT
jgi:hypothetical protein